MNTEENKQIMARNIKRFMEKKGVTNQQVCDALNLKYTTFRDWIKGITYPRIGKVEAMAQYFGCEKSDLIEDKTNEEIDTVTIGNLFENLRKERNLSLAEFSEEIGLSAEEILKYETGKGGIPSNIVKMLADYFGISYGQLSAGRVKTKDIFAAFTSTNEAYVEQVTKWVETFGNERFSDEEFGKIIDYAKFILSQRK